MPFKTDWASFIVGSKFTVFALFYFVFEGLIFGGAYIRRGLSTDGNLRFRIDWASLITGNKSTILLCFTIYLRAIFQVQVPRGLIFGGAI